MNDWTTLDEGRSSEPSPTDCEAAIGFVIVMGVVFIGLLPTWLPKVAAFLASVPWVWGLNA